MMRPVALLTDFGLDDPYVGQMKGTLARLAPCCTVLDVCHGVAPFQVAQGAFFLAASMPHFPANTIFTAVVDPGVGSPRRIVLCKLDNQLFLAPDNGLLGLVLYAARKRGNKPQCYDATRTPASGPATFQGRDVFAPLSAELAQGLEPHDVGAPLPLDELVSLPATTPRALTDDDKGSKLTAHVLHVDRFGNVVLNLSPGSLFPALVGTGQAPGKPAFPRCVRTYADLHEHEVGILVGSQGLLELAVNLGSAAKLMGCSVGHTVSLTIGTHRNNAHGNKQRKEQI
ncbi:MAG: SAM-dependent chlorinase/fluorinase [Desulfovibrionaceae bacterium]